MGVLDYRAAGISRSQADGRYIKRFVGATLAGDTISQLDSAGATEYALTNPNGVVQGRIPLNIDASLNGAGDGGRFEGAVRIIRAGTVPILITYRTEGTLVAPTGVLINQTFGQWQGSVRRSDGTTGTAALIRFIMRENATASGNGATVRIEATPIASTTRAAVTDFRHNTGVAELALQQLDGRIVPLAAGTLGARNPLNTGFVWQSGADDFALFGGARVTRRGAIADPAGGATIDAEARTAIIAILNALRPTTGINLIAP